MKPLIWLVVAIVFLSTIAFSTLPSKNWTLLIVGGTEGYLSPCGCTSPMSGGIKRRITALKNLSTARATTIIDNGPLVALHGRQDQIKLETLAEAMALVHVNVTHYGLEEATLGIGTQETLERLSNGSVISSLKDNETANAGPFLVGGVDSRRLQLKAVTGSEVTPIDQAISKLIVEAKANSLPPLLMLRGDEDAAIQFARRHPALRLIVCTRQGSPFAQPLLIGHTWIVTPGEHGKYVVKIEWDGNQLSNYQSFDLGPEFQDDNETQEIYSNYLARVGREKLLEMVPREITEDFAGNAACATCHVNETKIWKDTNHAHALSTLEHTGHDRDPDCVACHVVGLKSISGFTDREKTPLLSDVGCESCHGPAKAHAMEPTKSPMAKVGDRSCMPCHNTAHSPNFKFKEYWSRIAH